MAANSIWKYVSAVLKVLLHHDRVFVNEQGMGRKKNLPLSGPESVEENSFFSLSPKKNLIFQNVFFLASLQKNAFQKFPVVSFFESEEGPGSLPF